MKRNFLALLFGICAFMLVHCAPASQRVDNSNMTENRKDPFDREITGPVAAYGYGGTAEMTNPFFWVRFAQEKGFDTEEVMLTPAQIRSAVEDMANQGNLRLRLPETIREISSVTHEELLALARSHNYMERGRGFTHYVPRFAGSRPTQLGVMTSWAQMTRIPTATPERMDLETGIEVAEGVVIYHDYNGFLLVKAQNYFGWIPKNTVAIATKEQFNDYVLPEYFVIVTAERILASDEVPTMLRMGTKLPLVAQNGNDVTFRVPMRNEDGTLGTSFNATLPLDDEELIHVGYLPFTTTNLLKQMFRQLGQVYGWGDQNSDRDCSSAIWAAYKCFGFLLPRNTAQQRLIEPGNYTTVIRGDNETIFRTLSENTFRPGAIVLMPGHVMMYLGEIDGEQMIIHQSGGTRNAHKVTGLNIYRTLCTIVVFE